MNDIPGYFDDDDHYDGFGRDYEDAEEERLWPGGEDGDNDHYEFAGDVTCAYCGRLTGGGEYCNAKCETMDEFRAEDAKAYEAQIRAEEALDDSPIIDSDDI